MSKIEEDEKQHMVYYLKRAAEAAENNLPKSAWRDIEQIRLAFSRFEEWVVLMSIQDLDNS